MTRPWFRTGLWRHRVLDACRNPRNPWHSLAICMTFEPENLTSGPSPSAFTFLSAIVITAYKWCFRALSMAHQSESQHWSANITDGSDRPPLPLDWVDFGHHDSILDLPTINRTIVSRVKQISEGLKPNSWTMASLRIYHSQNLVGVARKKP